MRVLLLTQVLPYPPDSGAKLKTLNVLKSLAPQHDVTLVSFVRGDQRRDIEPLRAHCKAVHTVEMRRSRWWDGRAAVGSLRGGGPALMLRDDRPEMRALIAELTTGEPFDVVHADQLNMCQYALRVPHAARVFDAHNALWLLCQRLAAILPFGMRRFVFNREARLLRTYEGRMCRAFDAVLAVSADDRDALEAAGATPEAVTVLPITIDTQEVQPLPRQPARPPRLVYIGQMRWPPNVDAAQWFALAVLPEIRARHPDVVFQIIGADPPRSLRALADPARGIEVLGYIDDPSAHLARAAALVVPLRAATGMRVKILDGMARGIPILTTKVGCSGIAVEPGRHVLIADDAAELAAATLRLLDDPVLAQHLSEEGRRLVETQYDWRVHRPALQAVYRDAVTRAARRRSDA